MCNIIKLSSIIVGDRLRKDYGDLSSLDSIKTIGLIQPIVLQRNPDGTNTLIAGGRRYAKLMEMGCEFVYHSVTCTPNSPGFVYRDEIPEHISREIELYENLHRKEMTWQERVLSYAEIHNLKQRAAALEGERWGMMETANELGLSSDCSVKYAVIIAKLLKVTPKDEPIWNCDSMMNAWRLLMKREEDAALADIARQQASPVKVSQPKATQEAVRIVQQVQSSSTAMDVERKKYESNPLNTIPFDDYIQEKMKLVEHSRNLIYLSNRVFRANCLDFMKLEENQSRFDHCITDPPYAIDVEMMAQDFGGLKNIETVKAEHEVEPNIQLIKDFFPAVYNVLKPHAFCIVWADQMYWQLIYDTATAAGFKVQRWPFHWIKDKINECKNASANVNFTKCSEIAVVCRKGTPTMMKANLPNYVMAHHDEVSNNIQHPFAKPFAVWQPLIEAVSMKGQTIYEPFGGGGSGVLSMLKLDRNPISTELKEEHYNDLVENVKKYYLNLNPRSVFE